MRKIIFIIFILFNYRCDVAEPPKELPEDFIPVLYTKKSIYQVKETGWTVQVPGGWEIIPQESIDFVLSNRNRLYNNSLDININEQPDNLIYIRNQNGSGFYTKMKRFKESVEGNYDDYIIKFHESVKDHHRTNNTGAEYQLGAIRIDGIMFDRFNVKINKPLMNGKPIQQTYFMALVNGFDFEMTITWTDEGEEETLLNIIRSSRFSIKK